MTDDLILECEVIGSFINSTSTHDFIDKLKDNDFQDSICRQLFRTIKQLREQKNNIDLFTVNSKSKVSISTIANITSTVATTATIDSKVKLLKDRSNRRKLIQKANTIILNAKDTTRDIGDIKNDALAEIEELEDIIDDEVITLKQAMIETQSVLDKRYTNKGDKSYYTGIRKLDNVIVGLHKEELTTIGARPGVGKTILGMQIALNIANNHKKIMYTSLEMSVTQLCERIISSNTDINNHSLRTGDIKDNEWIQIIKAASVYSLDNFLLDKTSKNTIHIRAKLRKYKPDILVIDYLQLLEGAIKEQSREREVATITRDLKRMCLEFKIPIVILCQLNRNAEGRRPIMADLRESGAIEQDSDNIIFIHEPGEKDIENLIESGIYSRNFFESMQKGDNTFSQLIIEKQRNGQVGTIDVIKIPRFMKFIDINKGDW